MLGLKKLIHVEQNLAFFAKFQRNFLSKCQQKNKGTILQMTSHNKRYPLIINSKRFMSDGHSSIDKDEIERFEKWAKAWWVENGEYEALHRMNILRVPLIKETLNKNRNYDEISVNDNRLITQPLLGLNILDVGCGGGILSEPLARLGANVTGIDACKENIISAQLRAETQYKKSNGIAEFYERIRYINCSLEDLAMVDDNQEYFDAIVISEVVEHVNNLDDFLMNSTQLLKNRGFSFITTINRTTPSYLLAILAAEHVLGLVAKGTHTWEKFVKPEELKYALEKNQVFVKSMTGMCYNPLSQKWSWSDDTNVNYAMYAQKISHD